MFALILSSSSKFTVRMMDNEGDEEIFNFDNNYHSQVHRPGNFEKYLQKLLASTMHDYGTNKVMSIERQRKTIGKGDPREFMG